MQTPLVSIITPLYNYERYIALCIESVLAQTYSHWEMLIVDDNSTDQSYQIAQEYARKDTRIKVYKTEVNKGNPSFPRNMALKSVQGSYIAFLDADDLWLPEKLEWQLEYMQYRNASFSYTNWQKIDENGCMGKRIHVLPTHLSYQELHYGNPICLSSVMLDRCSIGDFYFQNKHHEDCIAWFDIMRKGIRASNVEKCLTLFRKQHASLTSNKWKILSWQWSIYRDNLGMSFGKSLYYYLCYAWNACKRYLK